MATMTALPRLGSGTGRSLAAFAMLWCAIVLPAEAGEAGVQKTESVALAPEADDGDALADATRAARLQAARAFAIDGECSVERPTEATLGSTRETVRHIASLAVGAAGSDWDDARIPGTLLDLAVGATYAGRAELARWSAYLAALAPTPVHEASLLEAAIRIVEPVLLASRDDTAAVSSNPIATPRTESQFSELGADLDGWMRRLDALTRSIAGDLASDHIRERIAHFEYGRVAPRFAGRDTAGNEIRSVDFVGKVVVYRFWSNESPVSIAAHERDAAMFRSYWDAPFELVGVSSDDDREYHVSTLYEHDFGGTQVFDGPISTELVDALAKSGQTSLATTAQAGSVTSAWSDPPPGSLFVVDAQGVIRGRDLAGQELHDLIDTLIAEHHLRVREQQLTRFSR